MAQGTSKELKEAFLNVQGHSAVEFFFQKVFLSGLKWEKVLETQCDCSHLQSHLLNDA